jgi:hypothetical protein
LPLLLPPGRRAAPTATVIDALAVAPSLTARAT